MSWQNKSEVPAALASNIKNVCKAGHPSLMLTWCLQALIIHKFLWDKLTFRDIVSSNKWVKKLVNLWHDPKLKPAMLNATIFTRRLIVSIVFVQSQRPEAREPAPGWEEQHPYCWLWHGLPTGGRQSVRDQLWVSTYSVSVFLNNVYKKGSDLVFQELAM